MQGEVEGNLACRADFKGVWWMKPIGAWAELPATTASNPHSRLVAVQHVTNVEFPKCDCRRARKMPTADQR